MSQSANAAAALLLVFAESGPFILAFQSITWGEFSSTERTTARAASRMSGAIFYNSYVLCFGVDNSEATVAAFRPDGALTSG